MYVCIYIFFIHSSVDGNLGCFHVLSIVNSAEMNIGVHVILLDHVFSLDICPGVGLQGHMVALGFPDNSVGKESACNAGDPVQSLGQENPLEKG